MAKAPQDRTQRCADIKDRTEKCWRKEVSDNRYGRYERYIKELLGDELHCANLKKKPCDVLVLMLGFSFEPLLQVIALYQPRMIK